MDVLNYMVGAIRQWVVECSVSIHLGFTMINGCGG